MKTKAETAVELHASGFNCAQSVFSLFCEKYGMEKEQGLKVACGLGGGFRSGEICGALSGAVLAVGLKYGHSVASDAETKAACYAKTVEFINEFKARNNSLICRELLGVDVSTKEGFAEAQSRGLMKTICAELLTNAVEILEENEY